MHASSFLLAGAAITIAVSALPASAERLALELLPGHAIQRDGAGEAGVAMALAITPEQAVGSDLIRLCKELGAWAGLEAEDAEGLRLEVIFVVPRKGMAVEGYYFPHAGASGSPVLVPGNGVLRESLDAIVTRAGFPAAVLDETEVEHEISCALDEPIWHLVWQDIRPIGNEGTEAVIERARRRFLAVYQTVVEQNGDALHLLLAKKRRETPIPGE